METNTVLQSFFSFSHNTTHHNNPVVPLFITNPSHPLSSDPHPLLLPPSIYLPTSSCNVAHEPVVMIGENRWRVCMESKTCIFVCSCPSLPSLCVCVVLRSFYHIIMRQYDECVMPNDGLTVFSGDLGWSQFMAKRDTTCV